MYLTSFHNIDSALISMESASKKPKYFQKRLSLPFRLGDLPSFGSNRRINSDQKPDDLHLILQNNPSLCIVQKFVKAFPSSLYEINYMGHYPLQTALTCGTTPDIVKFLAKNNKEAVQKINKEGRTSLHLSLDGYSTLLKRYNYDTSIIILFFSSFIDILSHYGYSHINVDDNNGMNALEYALEKEVAYPVVEMLHKLSVENTKRAEKYYGEEYKRKGLREFFNNTFCHAGKVKS